MLDLESIPRLTKSAIALHEAAHAVVARALGLRIGGISAGDEHGRVDVELRKGSDGMRRVLLAFLAGDVACRMFLPDEFIPFFKSKYEENSDAWQSDLILNRLHAIDGVNVHRRLHDGEQIVGRILTVNQSALVRVRNALYWGCPVVADGAELSTVQPFAMPLF